MKKSAKYTMLYTFSRLLKLVYKSQDAWRVMLVYALFLTAVYCLSVLMNTVCSGSVICGKSVTTMIILLPLVIILSYIYDFYQNTFLNAVFKLKNLLKFDKDKLKSMLFELGYVLTFFVPIKLAGAIISKPANPNWKIEFMFFCVLFAVCMLPLGAMRFSYLFTYFLKNLHLPSLKCMFMQTIGRSYIGIIGFLLIILILAVFNMQLFGYEAYILSKFPSNIVSAVVIYFIMLTLLFSINVIICFFEAQRQLIEEEEINSVRDEFVSENTYIEEKPAKTGQKRSAKTKTNKKHSNKQRKKS